MWKRLRGKETPSAIRIGGPTLLESTYDQGQLERAETIYTNNPNGRPLSAIPSGHAPARLPTMQFSRAPPTIDSTANRPSVAASSVYSQASPDFRNGFRASELSPSYYGEISPPGSPTISFQDDNGRVSPIEESSRHDSSPRQSQRQGSQIPVPRKAAPENAPGRDMRKITPAKAWTKDVGKKPMQWDDYSGEPTFDGEGKPAQVKPGEFNLRAGLKSIPRRTGQPAAGIDQDPRAGYQDKASRLAQKGMPSLSVDTAARPAWKGASGRQALVPAPEDNPGLPAPKPRRSSTQMEEPIKSPLRSPQNITPHRPVAPVETTLVASPSVIQEHDHENTKPTPPLKTSQDQANINVSPPGPCAERQTGYPSPVSSNERAITPTQAIQDQDSPTALRAGDITLPKRGSRPQPDQHSQSGRISDQYQDSDPVTSRFSWTTTNTSTTYQNSPPASPRPPMPIAYANMHAPPSPVGSQWSGYTVRVDPNVAPSILSRGHPTRSLGDQAAEDPPSPPFSGRTSSLASRKPVPVPSYPGSEPIRQEIPLGDWREGSTFRVPPRAASLAPSTSTSMNSKALPKTPGEISSVDLITSLQAQQNDLQQQRFNISRIIRDLEKPVRENPLYTDFRARREKDKRCEVLKKDLAEVISAEHEVGLRLHRAWKRREKEDPNTPGSILWVRRATSGI